MSERVVAWQCNLLLENEKCTTLLLSLDCLVMELIEWKKRPRFFVAICSMHIIGSIMVQLKSNIVKTNRKHPTLPPRNAA